MRRGLFTSESVTEGHPDKLCDRISDAVLDAALRVYPQARVACECLCTTGLIVVAGEMTERLGLDLAGTARQAAAEAGYDGPEAGFDAWNCAVLTAMDGQSPDIALGTSEKAGGAGDQGMMFGYACRETPCLMPLPITAAHMLAYRLAQSRKEGRLPGFLPDGKTQVTVRYSEDGKPAGIDTVLISAQHRADAEETQLRDMAAAEVLEPVLRKIREWDSSIDTSRCRFLFNPTGRFVKGGPAADTGLTGRKIAVDTYGGCAPAGGGAFSGKDPSKVDRSGAYMARYIAKNIVSLDIAQECTVQLAYAIGIPEPVSVCVCGEGLALPAERIEKAVRSTYDLTPQGIRRFLRLDSPVYTETSAYGHFGDCGALRPQRSWEETDDSSRLMQELERLS